MYTDDLAYRSLQSVAFACWMSLWRSERKHGWFPLWALNWSVLKKTHNFTEYTYTDRTVHDASDDGIAS